MPSRVYQATKSAQVQGSAAVPAVGEYRPGALAAAGYSKRGGSFIHGPVLPRRCVVLAARWRKLARVTLKILVVGDF